MSSASPAACTGAVSSVADGTVLPHGQQPFNRPAWWRAPDSAEPKRVTVTDVLPRARPRADGQAVFYARVVVEGDDFGTDVELTDLILDSLPTLVTEYRKEANRLTQLASVIENTHRDALVEKAIDSRWCPKCNADAGDECDWGDGRWPESRAVHPQRMRGVTVDI